MGWGGVGGSLGGGDVTPVGGKIVLTGFVHGNLKVRGYLENLSVDVNIILKYIWSISHRVNISALRTSYVLL
jgi:hypothetical protein